LLNETAYKLYSINIDKTFKYAQEAGKLADQIDFVKGKAESFRLIGIYYKMNSDYPKALEYYEKALKINEEIENKNGISKCLNNIGIIYMKQGRYPQSIESYQKSLKINIETRDKEGVSKCLNNIGIIYMKQSNYPQALENYQKALKINNDISDRYGISDFLGNIGIIYKKQGDYPKALESFQKSLKIKEEIEDKLGIANCLIEIGNIQSKQGNYTLEYFQKSLKISEEIGSKFFISFCFQGIGNNYYYQENYLKALEYTLKSLKIAKELEMLSNQKVICKQLSEIHAATGKYKKAYKNYKVYKELNDSIFNEKNIEKIIDLEYQYKYEREKQATELIQQKKDAVKNEKEKRLKIMRNSFIVGFIFMIILVLVVFRNLLQKRKANRILAIQKSRIENSNDDLHQQNEEIQQLNEELSSTNDQLYAQHEELKTTLNRLKETQSQLVQSEKMASIGILTSGIAHEINNPLNFIQGGVLVFKTYLEENLKEHKNELLSVIEMIETGVNRTTDIVQSLNQLNQRSESENKKCDIHKIINNCLFAFQNQTKDKIKIIKKFTDLPFTFIGKEGELHQVLLNVMTNAVQAIDEKGTITISTKIEKEIFTVQISDTGYGISKENITKVTDPFFTTKEPGKGPGLGMSIAYNIIKEHEGSIKYILGKGSGTTVIISLPISKKG